jgi:cyclic beta-1,2-glucan synthetase
MHFILVIQLRKGFSTRASTATRSKRSPAAGPNSTSRRTRSLGNSAPEEQREHDPSHHLIGGGRGAFERRVGFRAPISEWPRRFNAALGMAGLVGMALVLAGALLVWPLLAMNGVQMVDAWYLAALVIVGALPALDAAITLVNAAITREMHATALPGLDLKKGIPASLRTLVAVPRCSPTDAPWTSRSTGWRSTTREHGRRSALALLSD